MNGITLCTGQFYPHSFTLDDLVTFELFVDQHDGGCVFYSDVAKEGLREDTVAIRHDIDHSIVHAVSFAEWEAERGINSSYYVLPTAPYFQREATIEAALHIQELGHEIGVHNDAHCEAGRRFKAKGGRFTIFEQASEAMKILRDWVDTFRAAGLNVSGCADHGGGEPANVELWQFPFEYEPKHADLQYECYELHRRGANYISDNRGGWRAPLEKVEGKQSHVLIHPCHWRLP